MIGADEEEVAAAAVVEEEARAPETPSGPPRREVKGSWWCFGPGLAAAAMADQFADSACLMDLFSGLQNNVVIEEVSKGLNPGMIVLLVVATFLLLFFVGNYALYVYAQKTLPPRKKKPVSKKKMKREKLKQGVSAPGE
ncbi:hypothetical protein ABZP36_002719 [Zizania latifolia]